MTEECQVLDHVPFTLKEDSFRTHIKLEAYPELEGELERYLENARALARPRAMIRIAYVNERDGSRVQIGGRWFESEILAENLEGIHRVFAYTATCGPELYGMDLSGFDPLVSMWHDAFKYRALDAATTYVCEYVRKEYGIRRLASMNPGSGDVDVWPIDQQQELFAVLGDTEQLIGVSLTESHLMIPDKSVSGIFFPSETNYVNCQSCTREVCPSRRAPYKPR